MRKTVIGLLAFAIAAAITASPAGAVSLMKETFSYEDGDLTTQSAGNWVAHSGAATIPVQVTSGQAVLVQGSGTREDVNRSFAEQGATDKTYACFLVTVPDPGAAVITTYFAHMKDTGTMNFAGRVFVAASEAGFTFGLSATSGTMTTAWPVTLNYDQQYTVAVSYDAAAGSSELWVDPASVASPSITAGGGFTGTLISSFALRQSGGNTTQLIDNIEVGTSFEDTCPNPTPAHGKTWGRLKTIYR
jgi:hypothetical protein